MIFYLINNERFSDEEKQFLRTVRMGEICSHAFIVSKVCNLDFLISVGLRLLNFRIFSKVYGFIREPMLIEFV